MSLFLAVLGMAVLILTGLYSLGRKRPEHFVDRIFDAVCFAAGIGLAILFFLAALIR